MSFKEIARSVGTSLLDTLRGVINIVPEMAQAAEIDVAREATALGQSYEEATSGKGDAKKEIVLLLLEAFIGKTAMTRWGRLLGLVIDLLVARGKATGQIRKPTPEELADSAPG